MARSPLLRNRFLLLILAAAPMCVGACSSGPKPPPPIAPGATMGTPYVLKVGDYLDIRFYKTPELNIEVPVRSDGKISLELVGDVQAAGLQPDELSRVLMERYSGELTNPRVAVIVRSFGGQVFVSGEVAKPTAIPFSTGLTALQAISGAGGFATTAQKSNVLLMRESGGHYTGHRLELTRALSGDDPSADVPLQPTDIVFVPRSKIANVNLFVEQWIRNNLPVQPGIAATGF